LLGLTTVLYMQNQTESSNTIIKM